MATRARPILLAAVVVAALALSIALGLGERVADLREAIDDLGALGPVVYVAIYAAATVALVPASLLTIAAGALFGSLLGVVLVVIGAVIGACLAFLVARRLARPAVAGWLTGHPGVARVDRLTERRGGTVVLLTRLVPVIPFNLLNYALGLSRVRFRAYLLGTAVGIIPGTVLYVVGGDAVGTGLAEGSVSAGLVIALVGAIALLVPAVVVARRRLREAENASPAPAEAPEEP